MATLHGAVRSGWDALDRSVKWSWACRQLSLDGAQPPCALLPDPAKPRPGDVALVHVDRLGHHRHLESNRERRLRLYRGDRLAGVFGHRYATDVFEGRVTATDNLHLLTGSGVIGTVVRRTRHVGRPTALSFLGYLADASGRRINLVERLFRAETNAPPGMDVIAVLGTAMNAGKTTVTRKILRALVSRGVPVAGCKLTGTASSRDLGEMRATGADLTTDFSDYGFPSTYGASLDELLRLFDGMLEACSRRGLRLVVVEVADGFLQRETQMLLASDEFRRRVRGVILAGACSASALCAADWIRKAGFDIWAVSGRLTSSPLFIEEFAGHSAIPVVSSYATQDWAGLVMEKVARALPQAHAWAAAAAAE